MTVSSTNTRSTVAAVATALLAIGSLLAPFSADAQVKTTKIGYVNVSRLLAESPQANAANRALENEFAPRQRDITARQKAFKDRADKLQKDGAVMGAEERRTAEERLLKDERELKRQIEELREDVNVRRNEALNRLRVDLLREVDAFGKQGGFDVVLSDGVLYVNPSIDVTPQVLQALQARFGQAQPKPAAKP